MRSHGLTITEVCNELKIIIDSTLHTRKKEQKTFIKSARRVPSLAAGRAEPHEGEDFDTGDPQTCGNRLAT